LRNQKRTAARAAPGTSGTRAAPAPGRPVRGSTTGRPLMAALDLLGRRWALRILWELRDGPLGARELRARCDEMSSSVLYTRLPELTEAGLLSRDDTDRYELTALGRSLGAALEPLDAWAQQWASRSAAGVAVTGPRGSSATRRPPAGGR
jgi:DNA-binding HxlR family transcriptional regulator